MKKRTWPIHIIWPAGTPVESLPATPQVRQDGTIEAVYNHPAELRKTVHLLQLVREAEALGGVPHLERIPLVLAKAGMEQLRGLLAPGCDRIEEAGSIRREKATVKDIEFVIVPRAEPVPVGPVDMFGQAQAVMTAFDLLLSELTEAGVLEPASRNLGSRLKKFWIRLEGWQKPVKVELYLTTPGQWGYIYMLRTGPDSFNRKWVTPQAKGGQLPEGYTCGGGWIKQNGVALETPEEADVFRILGWEFVSPKERI